MNVHRFGESKINLDTLNRKEVLALNVYAHQHLGRALGEVATLNQFMNEQGFYEKLHPLPNLDYERDTFIDGLDKTPPGWIEPS